MANLFFKVAADYSKVVELQKKLADLTSAFEAAQRKGDSFNANRLNTELQSTRLAINGLVQDAALLATTINQDITKPTSAASAQMRKLSADLEANAKALTASYQRVIAKQNELRNAMRSGNAGKTASAQKAFDEEFANFQALSTRSKALTRAGEATSRIANGTMPPEELKRIGDMSKKVLDENTTAVDRLGKKVREFGTQAKEGTAMSSSLTSELSSIGMAAGASIAALTGFATKMIQVRGQFQQLEIAFGTMLGSEAKAQTLMTELIDIAKTTPFEMSGLASATRQLIAYGSTADNVGKELVMLGNVAAGVGSSINDIAYLYGTLRTQGRAYQMDIRQFAGRGIPILETLAEIMGTTKDKVNALVSAGKVGFPEIEKAFQVMTQEGGKFYNLMDKQSKSLTGQISNLQDSLEMMWNEMGTAQEENLASGIEMAAKLVDNYKKIGETVMWVVGTVGAYKAAMIAASALRKIEIKGATAAQQGEKERELAVTNAKIDEINRNKMVEGTYSSTQLAALDAEIEKRNTILRQLMAEMEYKENNYRREIASLAEIEAAQAAYNASIGTADEKSALEALNKAKENYLANIDKEIAQSKERIADLQIIESLAAEEGDAEAEKSAILERLSETENLAALEDERRGMVMRANNATEAIATATTNANTIAEQRNSLATTGTTAALSLKTVGTRIATTATLIYRSAIDNLKNSFNAMKLAFATNPFGFLITAITTLVGAIMTATSFMDIFSDTAEETSEEIEKYGESAVKTKRHIEELFAIINATSDSSNVHKKSVAELVKIYEDYGLKIDEEGDKLAQLNNRRSELINLLRMEGRERQIANTISQYSEQITAETKTLEEAIRDALKNARIHGAESEDLQNMAKEVSVAMTAIIQDYNDELGKLAVGSEAYVAKQAEIKDKLVGYLKDLGVVTEKTQTNIVYGNKTTTTQELNIWGDILKAATQYDEKTRSIVKAQESMTKAMGAFRDKIAEAKDAQETDYTQKKITDIVKTIHEGREATDELKNSAKDAADSVGSIGEKDAKPKVDDTSIKNAKETVESTKGALEDMNGKTYTTYHNIVTNEVQGMAKGEMDFYNKGGLFGNANTKYWQSSLQDGNATKRAEAEKAKAELRRRYQAVLNGEVDKAEAESLVKDLKEQVGMIKSLSTEERREYYNMAEKAQKAIDRQMFKTDNSGLQNKLAISQKEIELRKRTAEEEQKIAFETAEMRVRIMRDGSKKELAQAELTRNKALADIEKERKARIEAAQKLAFDVEEARRKASGGKDYAGRNFDVEKYKAEAAGRDFMGIGEANVQGLTAWVKAKTDETEKNYNDAVMKTLADEMNFRNQYLKEFGSFYDKKRVIIAEYEAKIAKTESEAERALLEAQKKRELGNVEAQAISAQIDWSQVFGEFGGMLLSQQEAMLSNLKEYVNTDEFRNADGDTKTRIFDTIQKLEGSVGKVPKIGEIGRLANEYQASVQRMISAQNAYDEAKKEETKLLEKYNKLLKEGKFGEANALKPTINLAQANTSTAAQNLEDAGRSAENFGKELTTSKNNLVSTINGVSEALQSLKSGSLAGVASGLGKLGDTLAKSGAGLVKKAGDALSKAFGSAGVIGEIVSAILGILDVLKDGIGTLVSSLIDTVMNAATGILQNILSGDLFTQVGGSLLNGVTGLLDTLTFGLFSGESDKSLAEDYKRLTLSNEELRKAIDGLSERISESSTADVMKLGAQMEEYIRQGTANSQEMLARFAAQYSNGVLGIGGSHSSAVQIERNFTQDDWRVISNIVGRSVYDFGAFVSLSASEMKDVADFAPQIIAAMKQISKDKGYQDISEHLDNYIAWANQLADLEKQINEKLTSTSFDSVQSDFASMLMDMNSDAQTFADSFEDKMRTAIINSMVQDIFGNRLEQWYKDFASAMDGGMSALEQSELERRWQALSQEALNLRDELERTMGWSGRAQSGSSGGFSGMSQDTANELNGRFTALQMAGETIKAQSLLHTTSFAEMLASMNAGNAAIKNICGGIDGIQDQIAKSVIELYEINQNTQKLVKQGNEVYNYMRSWNDKIMAL